MSSATPLAYGDFAGPLAGVLMGRCQHAMSDTPVHELDVHAALAALRDELTPITQRESVPLDAATGRVLAGDVVATLDLPAFANAAMDGYAVRACDCSGRTVLRLAGRALAGHGYEGVLPAGTAVRITTGAPMPQPADAVVIQEDAERDGETISFHFRASGTIRAPAW